MHGEWFLGLIAATWLLVCGAGPASAQGGSSHSNQKKLHDAFVSAGRVLYGEGKYAEAIEQFEKALEIIPEPKLFFNLAQAHRMAGNVKQALTYYRRFLEALPSIKDMTDGQKKTAESDVMKWIAQLEAEKLIQAENAEKERLEKERLEKERLEKERLEKERLEKERLEKERLERERLEAIAASSGPRRQDQLSQQWWFWTGIGATTLLALGTAWAGTRMLDYNEDWKRTWRDSDRDKAILYQNLADLSLVGALGAGLTVSVLSYLHLRKASPGITGKTSPMALVPACDGAGCMLTFTLEF